MIIGLVRHHPVNFKLKKWSDSNTFNQNMESYNSAGIIPITPDHDFEQWDYCYTSTMKRALKTAKIIYTGQFIPTDLLREVPLKAGFQTRLKIPIFLWALVGRLQWLFKAKTQPENREMSTHRAREFIHQHCISHPRSTRILVVSHGFFMTCLRRELLKLGFSGPLLLHVKNGKPYKFTKQPEIKDESEN
jgi:broad specificity phosphatase PhoE